MPHPNGAEEPCSPQPWILHAAWHSPALAPIPSLMYACRSSQWLQGSPRSKTRSKLHSQAERVGGSWQKREEPRSTTCQAKGSKRSLSILGIHLMAGRVPQGADRAAVAVEMETTFVENLRYAADLLAQEDMTGLVEPINNRITDPRYYLNTPHQAAAILEKVGRPNLKLQLDLFHCQIMDGNLSRNLETFFPLIGHIQIAQVPGRHEPDSPGELNFPYIFQLLESLGYTGYVGCEYAPKGDTLEGLGWLRSYWESRGLQHCGTSKATE
ncbi:putative hydroxypyruvate isomerase isoform X2 [Pezoporus flaviventris]|uniref:putative hydroxypyruvate isomerase isoform X2 n=1 Tax=Pezoporus flaviventris TaxID=889875 RepID=UPI002AB1F944|nr:putative hydroxypyruvate isomerase isoform X2 [Pezoporus flaviventris]